MMNEPPDEILSPPRAFESVLGEALIRSVPEDFRVCEEPLYEPCGSGEHAYLLIEKRNVAAGELIQYLSRTLGIAQRDVGVAGQKDKRAVTRQAVSVPANCLSNVVSATDGSVKVLEVDFHTNKLRTGHLSGNRFEITLRRTDGRSFQSDDATNVRDRLKELEHKGFPNYFGTQRFGHRGKTITKGLSLIHANQNGASGGKTRGGKRFLNKMAISAVQSAIFNLVLGRRVSAGTFRHAQFGDVVCRRGGIKPFLFAEESDSQIDDVIPMGPMPGPKMLIALQDAKAAEMNAMQVLGLSDSSFASLGKAAPGTRRRMVEFPSATGTELSPDGGLRCRFTLPPGGYATVLLAEVIADLKDSAASS